MLYSLRIILIALLWLASDAQPSAMALQSASDAASKDVVEQKMDNTQLIKVWQDSVLANPIVVNYLNILAVLASRTDFPFVVPAGYSVQHVQNIGSFRQTITQLTTNLRTALTGAREDLNRVHTGMERVPNHLKTILVLMKEAPAELLFSYLPGTFSDIEKLVNDSLTVLSKPEQSFRQVLSLVTEIDRLVRATGASQLVQLQVADVKTQWTALSELMSTLAKLAKTNSDSLILQFNWILAEFSRPELAAADSNREFLVSLILRKIVEIDQSSDLLATIGKAYTDVSFQITDDQIGGNAHLLLLTSEDARLRYVKEFRYDLVPQVIQGAQIAAEQQAKFLRRDRTRQTDYDKFLSGTSINDLMNLLG